MGKALFQFKQFQVQQQLCAMKVNTDGVLLGSWAKAEDAKRILDIGTGTGVIALMMAQTHALAQVDAIDIDLLAAQQAEENFRSSPWRNRLQAYATAIQDFMPPNRYDFIVSNPPYFVNDLPSVNARKAIAKHSVELSYDTLLKHVHRLISVNGRFAVVIPFFNKTMFLEKSAAINLFPVAELVVRARENKAPYLILLLLETKASSFVTNELSIQSCSGEYTNAYKALTAAFYLKF